MRRGRRGFGEDIESPCIKVCKLENNRCTGCYRTSEEIREWTIYTKEKRDFIMHVCSLRAMIAVVDKGI